MAESERAEEELFVALYPGLRRFASVVRPREVDADDLVQEAVARALALRPLTEHDDPGRYLRATIVNLAANDRRAFARRRLRPIAASSPPSAAEYPSDLQDLLRLGAVDRAVLYLTLIEGRPFSEVGDMVGIREEAARARSSRALQKLRVNLKEELRDA